MLWQRSRVIGLLTGAFLFGRAVALAQEPGAPSEIVPLPEVLVTAPARLPVVPLSPTEVPASVQVITGEEIRRSGAVTIPDFLQRLQGVHINDQQGNSYQLDLSFRGFTGTSVTGTPQGISVFVDGVRVNEPAVEEINFDLIPLDDVERIELIRGPTAVFGRNTLAGSLNIITRRGSAEREFVPEISGGSFGRQKYRLHIGGTEGPIDYYFAGTHFFEDGFRDESDSRLDQFFGKLGYRRDGTDITLSYQYQHNKIKQAGSLPLSAIQVNREQNFSVGDFFEPDLHQATLNARQDLGAGFSLALNGFVRKLDAEQFNVSLISANSRLFNETLSGGGTLQLTHEGQLLGRKNLLTLGAEYARHDVAIRVFEEQNERTLQQCVAGAVAAGKDAADACPLKQLHSDISDTQDTFGLYIQDIAELWRGLLLAGDSLVLTAALRYDSVRHDIKDTSPEEPGKATGVATFTRPTPRIGLNYNLSEQFGIYFSYSEGFRAPAFLELTCADPTSPCVGIQAGVAPDTGFFALRPVEARSYELGLRARPVSWLEGSFAVYRTDVQDDIFSVSPAETTKLFFQNVGDTKREGIEIGLRGVYKERLEGYLNYAYTRATFQSDIELASPRTPGKVEQVREGNQLPLTPNHRINAGLRYLIHKWVTLSLNLTYVGDQFFRGDEANTQPKLSDYVVVNTSIDFRRDRFSGFLKINNLFNAEYETFGTFAPNAKAQGTPIEPFLTPGLPINVLVGASYQF